MSNETRYTRRSIALAVLASLAIAMQSTQAASPTSRDAELAQRLTQVEQKVQNIEVQVETSAFGRAARNNTIAATRASDTVYPWHRRMLEGN